MKRFKTKRKNDKRIFYLYIFLFILFIITFILLSTLRLTNNYQNLVNYSFNKINNKHRIINTISLENITNTPKFLSNKRKQTKNTNSIYIYNSHNQEKYQDDTTIYDASIMLKNNLNKLGINATVENQITNKTLNNELNYSISRTFLNKAIKKNEYQYYIDIHRDDANNTIIKINNKKYAKMLFVLGLDNPNYSKNKIVLEKMNNYLNENYPGISKGIIEKAGEKVNGIYNQDLNQNVILIEIGSISNNKEEVNNSTEIIALMMYYMLGD